MANMNKPEQLIEDPNAQPDCPPRGDRLSDAVFASHLAESAAAIEKIRRLLRDSGNDSD